MKQGTRKSFEKFEILFTYSGIKKIFCVQISFVYNKNDEADLQCVSSEHLSIYLGVWKGIWQLRLRCDFKGILSCMKNMLANKKLSFLRSCHTVKLELCLNWVEVATAPSLREIKKCLDNSLRHRCDSQGCPLQGPGVGLDDLWGCLPIQHILWTYELWNL